MTEHHLAQPGDRGQDGHGVAVGDLGLERAEVADVLVVDGT